VATATHAQEIQTISLEGNTLIPDSTILQQIESREGTPYVSERISRDLQHIYDIGFFAEITVDAEERNGGIHLTFLLEERPFISSIEFQGNDKIKDDQLTDILTLSPDDISDSLQLKFYPQKIHNDVENIRQFYHEQGYYNVDVTSQLLPDPDDPDYVTLQYTIEERKKATVRKITFTGNTAFTEDQLRKQMSTRKKGFFSFLTGSGKYEETTFETDLERLRYFYADNGYIEANIADYTLDFEEESSDLTITIDIDEGQMYTIDTVAISGNQVYDTATLQEEIDVSPGDPFSRSQIREDILAISDVYAQKGYLTPISENTAGKLLIDPQISIDRQQKHVALTYTIREGVPHFLNRITIAGNQSTRDKVIRRELNLQEGDLFNSQKMQRSQQKVINLGLFDNVEFSLSDGPADRTVDLAIDVTERSTGSFNFGGGYSSVDHFILSASISHANVFGLAHQVKFSTTLSGKSQTFNLNYTVPRFLDSLYTVGIDAYKTSREYSAYDSDSVGGGLRFGRRITDYIFATLKYEYKEVDITDVDEDASVIIREAEGTSRTSSGSLLLKRSTINNVMLPTKGMLTNLSGELAGGFLQGENDFYKLILDNNLYVNLYKDIALRFGTELAYANHYSDSDEVPIFERFFAGGASTIRGYEERSISPTDENGDEIGGNKRVVLTTELIIPLRDKFRLVTFFDTGDVYGPDEDIEPSTFKKSVGLGVRFYSPLGLIRLDWGYKLERESGESPSELHFGIGGLF
jgi:outer membrane protein insertion porin family